MTTAFHVRGEIFGSEGDVVRAQAVFGLKRWRLPSVGIPGGGVTRVALTV